MNKIFLKILSAFLVVCLAGFPHAAFALPQGATVVDGSATFNTAGSTLEVHQGSSSLIVNYNSFSIGSGETVRFYQPGSSSVALNRVVGIHPSTIFGTMTANGHIFLVNPNGIVFGKNATVDVGSLVASTLNITDADFKSGKFIFSGNAGSIVNYGTLNQAGGYIVLLSPQIRNEGSIYAPLGKIVLASGEEVALGLDAGNLISVVVNEVVSLNADSAGAAIVNTGVLSAKGGSILLTAEVLNGIFDHAINNTGVIEAKSLCHQGGEISLLSNSHITVAGRIEADGDIQVISSDGDVVHQMSFTEGDLKGEVRTNGGNFQGYAGGNYFLRNGASIDSGSGMIDLFAGGNILLGALEADTIMSFVWQYLSGQRGYRFVEFGYYDQEDGSLAYYPLTSGYDIGKDAISPVFGSGAVYRDEDFKLYTKFAPSVSQTYSWHTDPLQNADLKDHVKVVDNVYYWEDMPDLGDKSFDDAVLRFESQQHVVSQGPALRSDSNIFLTADGGAIIQAAGSISSENLALLADAGIFGLGEDGALHTAVGNLSALNKGSGDIVIANSGDLVVNDLTGLTGVNPGVTGRQGVVNDAFGGTIALSITGGLAVQAGIQTQQGNIVLGASEDITQSGAGDIVIAANASAVNLPRPVNLDSPSHIPGVLSSDNTVDVTWQVEDPVFESIPASFQAAAGGQYVMEAGTQIQTNNGDVGITAQGDVRLTLIDANLGAVAVTSVSGSILDNDLGTAPGDYDIIGRSIVLSAENGSIGGPGPGEEIDLKSPYDFSHVWLEDADASPDLAPEFSHTSFLDSSGKWVFAHTSDALADSDDWWFHVATVSGELISEKASLGPFVIGALSPDPDGRRFYEEPRTLRVYYEILSPSQFLSFEPATAIGLYAYHPLTPVDQSAFDAIRLDVDAYEFIDDNISRRLESGPYSGE